VMTIGKTGTAYFHGTSRTGTLGFGRGLLPTEEIVGIDSFLVGLVEVHVIFARPKRGDLATEKAHILFPTGKLKQRQRAWRWEGSPYRVVPKKSFLLFLTFFLTSKGCRGNALFSSA